jgi:hypothetical protein
MPVMRVRAAVTIAALLVPAGLSAQPIPPLGTGKRGPVRPASLPPQPEPIARNLAYKRLRLSVEGYPLVSYIRSPGLAGDGAVSEWASFGAGTRADYRLSRHVSLTLDLTSAVAGGPMDVYTAELGTRVASERSGRTLYRFVDLRVGYTDAHSSDDFGAFGSADGAVPRYADGFGAMAGVGMEYALTRTFSLTTAASVMRNRLTTQSFLGSEPAERSYGMMLYRYTLGIRYNPVRVIRVPGSDLY